MEETGKEAIRNGASTDFLPPTVTPPRGTVCRAGNGAETGRGRHIPGPAR